MGTVMKYWNFCLIFGLFLYAASETQAEHRVAWDELAAETTVGPTELVLPTRTWHGSTPACLCPLGENMIGDGGLLQPRVIVNGARISYFQNHLSKVSENNSALPQDRIGFNFSSLQRVPIGVRFATGTIVDDVQEYRLFGEKTLLDGMVSVDFVVPVYNTSERVIGTNDEFVASPQLQGEFGDLAFGIKGLLHRSSKLAVSAGMRVEAPTSEEIYVNVANTRLEDAVWHFTPYLATQWTPSQRLFANSFLSYRLNSTSMVSTSTAGTFKVREPTYLMVDSSLGYWWLRRPERRGLTGLASVLELHYTTSPESEPSLALQGISATGLSLGHTDYLNLTAGLVSRWNERISVTGAVVAPLRSNRRESNNPVLGPTDRTFNWAFLLNLNYHF